MSIYDEMYEVVEYSDSGWYCHFRSTYEEAYALTEELIKRWGAAKVVIKSPGGDMLRTFKPITEVAQL